MNRELPTNCCRFVCACGCDLHDASWGEHGLRYFDVWFAGLLDLTAIQVDLSLMLVGGVMELVWLGHEPMGNIHSDSIQFMAPWVNRISIMGKIRENRLFACLRTLWLVVSQTCFMTGICAAVWLVESSLRAFVTLRASRPVIFALTWGCIS